MLLVEGQVEDRELTERKEVGPARLEPGENLAFGDHEPGRQPRDLLRPRARCQHQVLRLHGSPVGAHDDAVVLVLPTEHALAGSQHGARRHRGVGVRDDATLAGEEAAVRLQENGEILWKSISGEAPPELATVDELVRKVELDAGT